MKNVDIKYILTKYKKAETSLQEEKLLKTNKENLPKAYEQWFNYAQLNKKPAPKNLENNIWKGIERHNIKIRKFTIRIIAAAASLILFASTIALQLNNKQSVKEKEYALNEALSMFENTESHSDKNILYEDDIIIIYTTME